MEDAITTFEIDKLFTIIRQLGKGSSGTVFLMREIKSEKYYAVKRVSLNLLKDKRNNKYFFQEIENLISIKNKNVTGINYEMPYIKDNNFVYIIMEYCNGKSLYDYVEYYKKDFKQNLSENDIQFIFKQLIAGLSYMIRMNIFHRDLKLENIMLQFDSYTNYHRDIDYNKFSLKDGTIKICDLGFSKKITSDVSTTVLGTPMNMAPEIVNFKNTGYTEKVDIWSLGCIFYQLLFGKPAFKKSETFETYSYIKEGVYTIEKKNKITYEAFILLNGMLRYNPKERFETKDINKQDFIQKDVSTFKQINLQDYFESNETMIEIDSKINEKIDLLIDTNEFEKFELFITIILFFK